MRARAALQETSRMSRAAAAALAPVVARAGVAIGYRRQELGVLALLAASVLGGFAIEAWHRQTPGPLDRLEAEPPRLAAFSRAPGPRGPGRSPDGRVAPARATPACVDVGGASPTPARPLDLNRATVGELATLPGIGPRLAARILARRTQLGGRFATADDLAGVPGVGRRKAELLVALVRVVPQPAAARPGPGAPASPAAAGATPADAGAEPP